MNPNVQLRTEEMEDAVANSTISNLSFRNMEEMTATGYQDVTILLGL